MTINTQKQVIVLAGPTGPTGVMKGVNILGAFTGPTGLFAQWAQYTGPTGTTATRGVYEEVYNIGPTGIKGEHKTVIIPGYSGGGGGAAVTWNPLDKGPLTVLSNGNLTSTNSDASINPSGVRATLSHSSGKHYIEYSGIAGAVFHDVFGFATSSQSLTAQASGMTTGFGVGDSGVPVNSGGSSADLGNPNGHNLSFAIDIDTGLWWFRYDGGPWSGVNQNSGDPIAETGGMNFTTATPTGSALFPFATQTFGGSIPMTITLLPGTATQVYAAPAGYTPWDGT